MKKMQRLISLGLSVLMLLSTFEAAIPRVSAAYDGASNSSQEVVPVSGTHSGQCGEAVTWCLDSDGVLTLEGIGGMYDYSTNNQPWAALKNSIVKIVVKDGVTRIGRCAFYGCDKATDYELAESVTAIGDNAFSECDSLTEIVLSDSITSIGSSCFAYCNGIASIALGDGLQTIPSYAFMGCTSLKTMTLPLSVRHIGYAAFHNCTSFREVDCQFTEVMWNTLEVGDSNQPFLDAAHHFETVVPAQVLYSGKCGEAVTWSLDSDGVLTLEGIGGMYDYSAHNQPWAALKYSIVKIVVKESVTRIGHYAFYGCGKATDYELAESVTAIGDNAFAECDSLTTIVISDRITSIGSSCFAYCNGIEQVVIGDGLQTIPSYAFMGCTSLKTMNLPLKVRHIGYAVFQNCTSFREVDCQFTEVMWNTLEVGDSNQPFLDAAHHFETVVPAQVLYSGKCGEAVTWSLDSDGVLTLEGIGGMYDYSAHNQPWAALKNSILKIVVKEGVTRIGHYAFYGCGKATDYELAESVTAIGNNAFAECDSLTTIVISDRITSIGSSCFAYCNGIEQVVIGNGLQTIPSYAFMGCTSLKTVTLPLTVRHIGYGAFHDCTSLEEVKCLFTEVMWNSLEVSDSNQNFLDAAHHFETIDPAQVLYSGKCGEAASWSLDSDGVLRLEGQGNLYQYSSSGYPWYGYRLSVTRIIADEKLGTIPDKYTKDCVNCTQIEMAEGKPTTGNSGEAVTWSIDSEGVLTISGIGAMYDYGSGNQPWADHRLTVTKVIIEEGITRIGSWAFYNHVNLQSVEMADSVEVIGSDAFSNCTALTELILGANVKELETDAFEYCTSLHKVVLSEVIERIGAWAFYGCEKLTRITLPFALRTVASSAFHGCTALETVHYEHTEVWWREVNIEGGNDSLKNADLRFKTIDPAQVVRSGSCGEAVTWTLDSDGMLIIRGTGAMYNYGSGNQPWADYRLTVNKVIIEDGVTRIGNYAFYDHVNLQSVEMADSVEVIGSDAFSNCTALTELTLGANVKELETDAFEYCTSLHKVVLSEVIERIGAWAFYGCEKLTQITLPFTLRTVASSAFHGCTALETVHYEHTEVWWREVDIEGGNDSLKNADLRFKTIDPAQVVRSGSCGEAVTWTLDSDGLLIIRGTGAMYNYSSGNQPWADYCLTVNKVIIEEGITRIGSWAFYNHVNLQSVEMADSVEVIGSDAFSNCTALAELTLGANVKELETDAFEYCTGLTKVVLGKQTQRIGSWAFYGCEKLTQITLPFALRTVGSNAFHGCTALETVHYEYNQIWWREVEVEGGNDPLKNTELHFTTIDPAQVVHSGNCGEAVTWSIDSEGVLIVSGIGAMYDYGHGNQPWKDYRLAITKAVIEDGVTGITGYAFADSDHLHEVQMAASVRKISAYAFRNCDMLTEVIVGEGVESIEYGAFADCAVLEKMTLPSKLTTIADDIFDHSPEVMIICDMDSVAEEYAIKHGIPYGYYFASGRKLNIELYEPNGQRLSSGYTVRWFLDHDLIGIGNTLYNVQEDLSYQYEIVLNKDLGTTYIQPAKTVVTAASEEPIAVTLEPFGEVEVSGVVIGEDDKPLSNAEIVFTQLLNGAYQHNVKTWTDAQGRFTARIADASATVNVYAEEYRVFNQNLSVDAAQGRLDLGQLQLTKLSQSKISVTFQLSWAVEADEEPRVQAMRSMDGLQFQIHNVTKDQVITAYAFQNGAIVFDEGVVSAYDEIQITAWTHLYAPVCATVTLDGRSTGNTQLTFWENGKIRYHTTASDIVLYVFEQGGKLVEKHNATGKDITTSALTDGTYQVVFMKKLEMINNVSQLNNLKKLGLYETTDYICSTVTVQRGSICVIEEVNVPSVDVEKLSYTVPENTVLTANHTDVAVGRYVSLRAQYQLSDRAGDTSGEYVTIQLPEEVVLVDGSVTLDGKACTYVTEENTLRINVGKPAGTIRIYVATNSAADALVEAFVGFRTQSVDLLQPIGTVTLQISNATMTAPHRTGQTTIPVKGEALAQSMVEIYLNGKKTAETTANKVGKWYASITLPDPAPVDRFEVYAKITTPVGVVYQTDKQSLIYDRDHAEVNRVTMINTAHPDDSLDPCEFVTVFEFIEADTSKHAYNYWPKYPEFTFIVEMTGDNVRSVQVVTIDQNGDETVVPCQYDKQTGNWIGTHSYYQFSDVPTNLYTVMESENEAGYMKISGESNRNNTGKDHVYTVPVTPEASKPDSTMKLSVDQISPIKGGKGLVTVCLKGRLFEPNIQIKLTNEIEEQSASNMYWIDHETVYATFDTSKLADGEYDVAVVVGQSKAILQKCFTVDGTLSKGSVSYEFHYDDSVKPGQILKGYLTATNMGYTDVLSPVVQLAGDNVLLGKYEAELNQEHTSIRDERVGAVKTTQIAFLQNWEGLAGTLAPGQTGVCSFVYQVPKERYMHLPIAGGSANHYEWVPNEFPFHIELQDFSCMNATLQAGAVLNESSSQRDVLVRYTQSMMGETLWEIGNNAAYMANVLTAPNKALTFEDICSAYAQDVIGLADSGKIQPMEDITAGSLGFLRSHQPALLAERSGMFGIGWVSRYEMFYKRGTDKSEEYITLCLDGNLVTYTQNDQGIYVGPSATTGQLVLSKTGEMTLTLPTSTVYRLDANGKLQSITDANGNTVQLTYENDEMTTITSSDGDALVLSYQNGKVSQVESAATGMTVRYEYDGDRLVRVKTRYGDIVYTYNTVSVGKTYQLLHKITYPDGSSQTYSYDRYGRVSQVSDGQLTRFYEYGLHQITVTDSLGNRTTSRYNADGDLVWTMDGTNTVYYDTYNDKGELIATSQGLLHSTRVERDPQGNPVKVLQPDGNTISYQYDAYGNVTSVTDPANVETQYERDSRGNLTAIIYADGSRESITYAVDGKPLTYTDRSGVIQSYVYDGLSNLTKVIFSTGQVVEYTYDAFRNLTSVTEQGKKTQMKYDDSGNLVQVIDPEGKTVSYTRDDLGRIQSVTDHEGYVTGYVYDTQGNLQNVTDGTDVLITFAYNTDGTLKRQTNANGTYTEYTYENNRCSALIHYGADGKVISENRYTYDSFGYISSMSDESGTWYYTYDSLGQCIGTVAPDGTTTGYTYDAAGNRTKVTVDGIQTMYTANELNQYTAYGRVTREYDANGNLIRETSPKGTATYAWDYLGRLVKYTAVDGKVYEYGYDAFGLRNRMTVNGETTTYLNDPTGYGYTLAEYGPEGAVHYNVAGGILASHTDSNVYYYHANHLGSVTEMTDKTGTVVNQYRYDQEGNVIAKTEGISNPFTYVGVYGIVNDGNGLIYDRARYVSTATDSFISVDPLRQGADLNTYRYVNNSLINNVDQTGEKWVPCATTRWWQSNREWKPGGPGVFCFGLALTVGGIALLFYAPPAGYAMLVKGIAAVLILGGTANMAAAEEIPPDPHPASPKADPSGYVYEAVTSNRLEGVKTVIYYEGYPVNEFGDVDYDAGLQMLEWIDAADYGEVNPQITDRFGSYGWDVLPGKWIVKYEKEGYETHWSDWMEVPPEYTDVNINLQTLTAPAVTAVTAYGDYILIEFSQYMDMDTIHASNIVVLSDGIAITGTFVPVNAGYNYEKTEQYASIFKFVPEAVLPASADITVSVANVKNYANIAIQEAYSQRIQKMIEPQSLEVPEQLLVTYLEEKEFAIQVLPANIGAGVKINVESLSANKLTVLTETLTTDENGRVFCKVKGVLPGETGLVVTVDGTMLTQEINCVISNVEGNFNICAPVTASYATGETVHAGTQITLSCDTEDARIYYALNGEDPRDPTASNRIQYETPIVLKEDMQISTYAVKDGMNSSVVTQLTYTVTPHAYHNGICSICGQAASGVILRGAVTSFGDATEPMRVAVYAQGSDTALQQLTAEDGSFTFVDLEAGEYRVTFSKKNHVTREYTVSLTAWETVLDAKIHLLGDISGDGTVNVADVAKLYAHIRHSVLTDEYQLECANVNGGNLNVSDVSIIYAHVRGTKKLY